MGELLLRIRCIGNKLILINTPVITALMIKKTVVKLDDKALDFK